MKNLWPLVLIMRKYVFFLPEDVSSNGNSATPVEHFGMDHQQLEQTRQGESQAVAEKEKT